MAKALLKATIHIFLLAITFSAANSARVLDDVDPQNPVFVDPPATLTIPPSTTLPSGQVPAIAPDEADSPLPVPQVPTTVEAPDADVEAPDADVAPITPPITVAAPIPLPTTTTSTSPSGPATAVPTSATVANPATSAPQLSFFMHDILGGSTPSVRVVTGIIARTDINGIPFSEPNNNFFPVQGGIPLTNIDNINNLINPNTAPLITGLNPGQTGTSTVLQNSGNNNNVVNSNNQPFVSAGQIPASSTLQRIMFGSITVIDDELTEGHELGSAVMGKAQGFYLASSLDGTSHTMALTIMLHGEGNGHVEDTISFFGVHRTASHTSQIAVIGGTGKYENGKGYATVETLPQENQHVTDGVDTVMHFNVYLSE
ncbi:hypothetical protein JCGZ_06633 [Jatropha curcas]|uniref:Dirigent protein n=1 Tax=Jatropha curcas TaxID=180498 RepID=A0A067LCJ1_JATCU|nr:dirigent protein 9 [Jatropha curcas]KDP46122.1 hypothetical protein JCGZ_06633 [Jatropha curcas]